MICGADNWVDIEEFGLAKQDWYTEQFGLINGIPSHDTFGAVFAAIDHDQFSACFSAWVADLSNMTKGEVIAIDGKCLRRSLDKASQKAAIHLVSAWAQQNSLVLGQVKVDAKSNEITAIPKLLERLDITGAIVTIDAMGCQKKIAEQIIRQGGDYVLSLKGNRGTLLDNVDAFFRHWVLDVAFDEDRNLTRKGHSAANLATIRHIALNLIKNEKSRKLGVKVKRLKAGWDKDYLLRVIGGRTITAYVYSVRICRNL